jgi:hypothetical protein
MKAMRSRGAVISQIKQINDEEIKSNFAVGACNSEASQKIDPASLMLMDLLLSKSTKFFEIARY